MRLVALGLLLLSACGPNYGPVEEIPVAAIGHPSPPPPPPPPPSPARACDMKSVQSFVGRPASVDLIERVRLASGAATARRITPEMRVTMEFRPDRVNVWVGLKGEVERISCG